MTQLIHFQTAKQNSYDKCVVDAALENELLGFAKQLYWSQLVDTYDKSELIQMIFCHLSFENKGILEKFIEENPSLIVKYHNLALRSLKKSAN